MSETLSITTAVDLTTCSPAMLGHLKEHAERVEQVARSLRLDIEREQQRRVREALEPGDWAREEYSTTHCVREVNETSVRALCGRSFHPEHLVVKPTFSGGTCRRCAEIVAK